MARSEHWTIPVYWYVERIKPRAGGFTMSLRWHWAKPGHENWVKTTRAYPPMRQIDRLLWPFRWHLGDHLHPQWLQDASS